MFSSGTAVSSASATVNMKSPYPHIDSSTKDLSEGKRLEVEEILGCAVRQATELGAPVPTLNTCYNLVAGINCYLQ